MKKLGILAMALVLGVTWLALRPAAVDAIDLECESGTRRTNPAWGMGATCAQADADAIAHATNMINCSSGWTCSETPEVVTPCYSASGQKQSDWRIRYVCGAD